MPGWNFTKHFLRIKIEGYQLHLLLSRCIKENIYIRAIQYKDETEMGATVSNEDYQRLKKLAKSKYKITVIRERGFNPYKKRLLAKKLAIAGVFLFAIVVFLQSMFIREVEVLGYESIPEDEIRLLLESEGLYAGCFKNFDCSEIEAEKMTEYFVHAAGTIKARVPYEIVFDMPREITEKAIKYAAEREIRSWAKKNMPQKAQILNNSLNFRQEENIIRVYVVIEVLQYIGEEQEIVIGEHKGRIKKDSN